MLDGSGIPTTLYHCRLLSIGEGRCSRPLFLDTYQVLDYCSELRVTERDIHLSPCYHHPMPRQARIDIPGLLQHVIVRGIERRKIFLDDEDRLNFISRLTLVLEATQTICHAWAMLDNHVHLLLMPTIQPLSRCMRKLLTGYAVSFNHRHKRSGHLFQNRYKSIVCDGDAYLMELVCYIHLNPVRAKMVPDMQDLTSYIQGL